MRRAHSISSSKEHTINPGKYRRRQESTKFCFSLSKGVLESLKPTLRFTLSNSTGPVTTCWLAWWQNELIGPEGQIFELKVIWPHINLEVNVHISCQKKTMSMDSKLWRKCFTASCRSHFSTSNIKGSHELEFTVRDTFVARLERSDGCALFTVLFWRSVPSPLLLAKRQGKQLLHPWSRNTAASDVKCQVGSTWPNRDHKHSRQSQISGQSVHLQELSNSREGIPYGGYTNMETWLTLSKSLRNVLDRDQVLKYQKVQATSLGLL